MALNGQGENDEKAFVEFRRKVRSAEVLSAAMEQLLRALQFTRKAQRGGTEWASFEVWL